MARLTAAKRRGLKSSSFALPKERTFPVNDKSHARNAKARASQMKNQGRITASQESAIDTRADRVLGKAKEKPAMAEKKTAKKGGHKHHHRMAKHHMKMAARHMEAAESSEDKPSNYGKKPAGSTEKSIPKKIGGKKEVEKPPTKRYGADGEGGNGEGRVKRNW